MKCPRCNGRKYIELDKIGLLVTGCPDCGGTGEIDDSQIGQDNEPIGRIIELKDEENHVDVVAELTAEGVEKVKGVGIMGADKDNPEYLLLSERMGDGESLEDLAGKAREIIKESQLKAKDDSGTGRTDRITGSGDTSQPKKPRKPKAKKKARRGVS